MKKAPIIHVDCNNCGTNSEFDLQTRNESIEAFSDPDATFSDKMAARLDIMCPNCKSRDVELSREER